LSSSEEEPSVADPPEERVEPEPPEAPALTPPELEEPAEPDFEGTEGTASSYWAPLESARADPGSRQKSANSANAESGPNAARTRAGG